MRQLLERSQRRKRVEQTGRDELIDMLAPSEIFELMFAEIAQAAL